MFSARARNATHNAVALAVLVTAPQHHGGSTRTQSQGGELAEEVSGGGVRAAESTNGVLLHLLRVFTVDDECVVDVSGVDHRRCDVNAVDETKASVGKVEVHGRRR